jgi:hypothetical protein
LSGTSRRFSPISHDDSEEGIASSGGGRVRCSGVGRKGLPTWLALRITCYS